MHDHLNAWLILDGAIFAVGFVPVQYFLTKLLSAAFPPARY